MSELILDTPAWAEPLLDYARYKGAYGGRGCCHPDTLIDTPSGQVKISEFKGGEIFSHDGDKIVVATATAAVPYTDEQLYLVTLDDGRSISVTDGHRFLTQRGWVHCRDLQISDALVCSNDQRTTLVVGVKSICKHDRLVYWDLHVPVLENYLSNGIVNHNSGKSHLFAENAVEEMIMDPHASIVCIREYQKSLKFSVKRLIESKIKDMKASSCFDIQRDEIRRRRGSGVMIFQGMQDHTADSIKSLDGFKIAWVEEAQNLSDRSLTLLRPTIRAPKSSIWATWNPDQPTDAIDKLLRGPNPPPDSVVVEVNYNDNPFLPDVLREEMEYDRQHSPDAFDHVWLGAYNKKTKAQIFGGKWRVEAFTPGDDWDGPYHGLDWGFSSDPTAAVRLWIHNGRLFVEYDASKRGLELDDTVEYLNQEIPGISKYRIIADNARPESISHCKRHGMPAIEGAVKGKGSVEDGIEFIRNFKEVVIHERCQETQREFRLYSYKVDKLSGDVLPEIVDAFNHVIDAIRYALEPVAANNDDFKRFLALT